MPLAWFRRWFCPSSRGREARSAFRPRVEGLEERCVPSVSYQGGPLLTNVGIESVFYGSAWSSPTLSKTADKLDTYLGTITNSPYMDQLQEYSEPGYPIGRGQFLDGYTTSDLLASGTTVSDQQIQGMLDRAIAAGQLQRPDANRLYFVFTPPHVHVSMGGMNSFNSSPGFLGYHGTFTDSAGQTVYYAVVVDQAGNFSMGPSYSAFQQFTSVASHELAESVTDPDTTSGWFDTQKHSRAYGDEIGDLAERTHGTLDGYTVQAEWSNLRFVATGHGPMLLTGPSEPTFVMQVSGIAYALRSDGRVWQRDANGQWSPFDSGVRSIALGNDLLGGTGTALYELRKTGGLWAYDGVWTRLDTGVKSFGVGTDFSSGTADGAVYVLRTNGQAWEYNGSWSELDTNVTSLQVSTRGDVYVRESDGSLREYTGSWTTVDSGVKAFALGPAGTTVDVLDTTGSLWQYTTSSLSLLDQHVVSIQLGDGGFTVFAHQSNGHTRQFAA